MGGCFRARFARSRPEFLLPGNSSGEKAMKVHAMSDSLSPALVQALAEFEAPFTYPLGPGKFFRITHGEDYTLFFRAMGEGVCFIAEHEGRVIGTLGTAIRRLRMPDGSERPAGYLGDLKIAAS